MRLRSIALTVTSVCVIGLAVPSSAGAATVAATSTGYDLAASASVSDPSVAVVSGDATDYKLITDGSGAPYLVDNLPGLTSSVVNTFDQYVVYSPTTDQFTLKLPAKQFDPGQVQIVQQAVAFANKDATSSDSGMAAFNASVDAKKSSRHGGVHRHWWGFTFWLDEWATNRLEAAIATGSGAAWVAAELTSWTGIGGLSAGAIAALLALTGGAVWLCDWNGRGINFEHVWGGPSWCWPR